MPFSGLCCVHLRANGGVGRGRADAQLLMQGMIVGCVYTHLRRNCNTVIFSSFLSAVQRERASAGLCECGLLTAGTVTPWLLTSLISEMSGRRQAGAWVHCEQWWLDCACVRTARGARMCERLRDKGAAHAIFSKSSGKFTKEVRHVSGNFIN